MHNSWCTLYGLIPVEKGDVSHSLGEEIGSTTNVFN
jgi:hypothetical protein